LGFEFGAHGGFLIHFNAIVKPAMQCDCIAANNRPEYGMAVDPFTKTMTPFMATKAAKVPDGAKLAVFGAPHGTPYRGIDNRIHQKAPDAFRTAIWGDAAWLQHWDYDFDGPLLPKGDFKAVDLGNLKTKSANGKGNRLLIETATRGCVEAGAVPVMFGGDDSTPIPFLAGFSGGRPITVLQIDAHIDWREERERERMGFSSTMRRASEMEHVWRIVQAGAHGLGSAREVEVVAAKTWGAHIISSRQILQNGLAQVLAHVEPDSDCVICLDLDVLDTSVMPAVAHPSPGGLSFTHVTDLIAGVAAKARIAGFAMVEFVPAKDPHGAHAYTAARIAAHVIAHVARGLVAKR
jgi:agmatinase